MKREDVIDKVVKYTNDEEAKYAIMINGQWGSGKTYLYEKYLGPAIASREYGKKEQRKCVYISLYGITSIDELAKELLVKFLSSKSVENPKKAEKLVSFSDGLFSIISKAFSFSVNGVSFSLDKCINELEGKLKKKDLVVCLDDFERCALPVNTLLGFVDNLIEHCNCKVIILADEKNIGKMHANENLENKYLTLLMGGRKLVYKKSDSENRNTNKEASSEMSAQDIKELNAQIYSDNFLYQDVKEKVIGLTISYVPDLSEVYDDLVDLISEDINPTNTVSYQSYLTEKKGSILDYFQEAYNVNIRLIKNWLVKFRKIYDECQTEYCKSKVYNEILENYARYSVWLICSTGKNIPLIKWDSTHNLGYVSIDDYGFNRIMAHRFIDRWIIDSNWEHASFIQSSKALIESIIRDEEANRKQKESTGKYLRELSQWYYYESDQKVQDNIRLMLDELEHGKYAYKDYSTIIEFLLFFKRLGLYKNSVDDVVETMKGLIEKSDDLDYVDDFPKSFSNSEDQAEYQRLFSSVEKAIKERNNAIRKVDAIESEIFGKADKFEQYCRDKHDFFLGEKSCIGYLGVDNLVALMKNADLKGKYQVIQGIKSAYNFSNISDFFASDLIPLKEFLNKLDTDEIFGDSIVEEYAKQSCMSTLSRIIEKLE